MSHDNIVDFPGDTVADVPVGKVLAGAMDAGLKTIIIIGECTDSPYYASSTANIAEMLLQIEMFKRDLLERQHKRDFG